MSRPPCNCDQSIALAERLALALEALDGIKRALQAEGPMTSERMKLNWVGSILALTEANLAQDDEEL